MIKYRVVLKFGYRELWFDFDDASEDINFASTALCRMTTSEDEEKQPKVKIEVIDTDREEKEEEE